MSVVVVERLPEGRYADECVALAKDYGSPAWDARPETAAIRAAVFAALDRLDAEGGIGSRIAGRPVLIKPNLVIVFNHLGMVRDFYPETTDPRVLDAVVLWLAGRAASITIVESSGRGFPTRASFKAAGLDRLARKRGCGLLALEEQSVDRYILPQATVQREILVPRVFSPVVRGEAVYVSVPKLKTNLYTGVTLGFKNAMGVIPYNLRQRNHHFSINRKLVEMLYLFKPALTVIDGVVGGEGECPAPVDPVDSRLIVAGDQAVETDRAAIRLMGFDPAAIELMRVADELGFGDPAKVRVLGDLRPVPFRPADRSLFSERVKKSFPGLRFLFGVTRPGADASPGSDIAYRLQSACLGGCLASTRFGLAMIASEGFDTSKSEGAVVMGRGLLRDGVRYWYDESGRAYDEAAIRALPGKKALIGSCGGELAEAVDYFAAGCMPLANSPHAVLHSLTGTFCRVLSPHNKNLFAVLGATVKVRRARFRLIAKGERLDVPYQLDAGVVEPRSLTEEEMRADWIAWPQPPVVGRREKKKLRDFEDDAAIASLRGVLVRRLKDRILWRSQAAAGLIVTLAPLVLAGLGAAGIRLWLSPATWLLVFGIIEAIHITELPFSLRAHARRAERLKTASGRPPAWRTILATLTIGYPAWVPYAGGVFD
jgi:uncharacterized protein (DUF362 family)